MPNNKKTVFNWSTGKDSALALYKSLREGQDICYLLTTLNTKYKRVSQHGVREALLKKQAEVIGIPLRMVEIPGHVDMETYSKIMQEEWNNLQQEAINISVFGDIHLDHLREYREKQFEKLNIETSFPLWDNDTNKLAREFIGRGFKAVVVSVNSAYLDKSYAGRLYDKHFLNDLPQDVDPCGEHGEFHTFVFDGPIFDYPIKWRKGKKVYRTGQEKTDSNNDHNKVCRANSKRDSEGVWFCDILSSDIETVF